MHLACIPETASHKKKIEALSSDCWYIADMKLSCILLSALRVIIVKCLNLPVNVKKSEENIAIGNNNNFSLQVDLFIVVILFILTITACHMLSKFYNGPRSVRQPAEFEQTRASV